MTYSSQKAEPADRPNTDVATGDRPKFSGAQSNQERFVGVGKKVINLRPSNEKGMRYMDEARETR